MRVMSPEMGCIWDQARGVPGTAVQWGAWGGSGMALAVAGFMERMARMGLGVVRPAVGLSVLAQVLRSAWQPCADQRAIFVGAPFLTR